MVKSTEVIFPLDHSKHLGFFIMVDAEYGFKGKAQKLQMKRKNTEKNACAAHVHNILTKLDK
ncbi:hypothetical protein NC653_007858 [Populus alba x Populus x berolinensis]|uniref:Uncharacterized protein n=1 Tax=Populus alba x Populus x berolinensis TaxID=444605 RepID=A0AAD6W9A8_9ROSI|nr:hypothetical protein NC653_007856 [Populus alba x Populus x berolinensis]KAJ7002501.1 hypothetical protein NC653_007858 [Populus alba x Populus x berolinensis]